MLYFAGYEAVVGHHYPQTGIGSIAVSSIFPPLLGAALALLVSRYTRRAAAIFAAATLVITGLSLLSVFSSTLGDGTPKPPGFDGLVLPMHVVVGATAAWAVARALRVRQCHVRSTRRAGVLSTRGFAGWREP